MARHKVTETAAFELLLQASQNTNTKLRNVAEAVTQTGDIRDGATIRLDVRDGELVVTWANPEDREEVPRDDGTRAVGAAA